ncbi:aldehyde dehydrogenase family protein [Cupriavidus basilensis]|uniref:Aldehyde dehydrogenase family protein n=1 Tax=Cupriavidus basilensis TaxID=68895 RepID=A0ABT6AVQ4_9BURK|nr:aldehyde dehydrogenase family protein [Cupriavidus basilensis]MDF3836699.1 aldehyde dehydrogenase family protein [Cupriavidus basilensis]
MNLHAEPDAAAHPFLSSKLGHAIDGYVVPSASGKVFETLNPATGQVLAHLAEGDATDVDKAVRAARAAFEGPWSTWTPYQRLALLMRVHDLVEARFDEMARLETLDVGSPITRARNLKNFVLQTIAYFATQTVNVAGETLPNNLPGSVMTMTVKAPIGVVGGILTWNSPLVGQWHLVGGALATGCTVVLKPCEYASLSVLYMANLLLEAGVPDGVVNVVTGYGPVAGAALAAHPDVDRIMFSGSVGTGRRIVEASAGKMKAKQVGPGGKSPNIVFADADLDAAVPGAAMAVFNNSGRTCTAGTRVFVQRSIYHEFVERLTALSKTVRVGNGLDPDVQMGPVISQQQLDHVTEYVQSAVLEGATLATGGGRLHGELANGYFVQPTVLSNVTPAMTIARAEISGPVIMVLPFDDADDALRMTNAIGCGHGGAVWTRDVTTAMKMAHAIQAGCMWVNCHGLLDNAVGINGYGANGGPSHVDAFLHQKSVYINLGGPLPL